MSYSSRLYSEGVVSVGATTIEYHMPSVVTLHKNFEDLDGELNANY